MTLIKRMEASIRFLDKTLEYFAIFTITVSVLLAFAGVILRYQFGISYEILAEISTYAIVYGVFIYMGPLIKQNEHIKMTILQDLLKEKSKKYIDLFISLILFFSFLFLLYAGIGWISSLLEMKSKTLSGGMLLFIPALSIVIGMVFGLLYSTLEMCRTIFLIRSDKSGGEE